MEFGHRQSHTSLLPLQVDSTFAYADQNLPEYSLHKDLGRTVFSEESLCIQNGLL